MPLSAEQKAQLQLNKILDYAFPITDEIRKCRIEHEKIKLQRAELTRLIEEYRKGVEIKKSPLLIKVNLEEIFQMMNN